MNTNLVSEMSVDPRHLFTLIIGIVASIAMTSVAYGQIDGFTEPYRMIEMSSDESGSIAEMRVEEGDSVSQTDIVACLDTRVQQLQLEISKQTANSRSQLVAAEESLKKRQLIFERLQTLVKDGHARPSELIRAEMELTIANAKVLSAKEEAVVHEIEMRRAEVLLDRRYVRAPFDGVISKIHRQAGEFLSPLRPEIATIVQIDRLLATFMIPSSQISQFQIGNTFEIELESGAMIQAQVHRVGVVTDAQSGTVEVKLVIENPNHEYRSGEICILKI